MNAQMNVQDFEEAFADAVPLNGNVLVEVIDKDPNRTMKSGIVVPESAMNSSVVNPYLMVVAIAPDVVDAVKELKAGDIIQVSSGRVNMFNGKDMKRFALVSSKDISAVHKHIAKKRVNVTRPDGMGGDKITQFKKNIIIAD